MTMTPGQNPKDTATSTDSSAGVTSLVSVIMPVYNGCAFLPETFAAVDRQTYPKIERIAVDDGSTDGSVEVIRRHGGWTLRVVDRGGSNRARVEGLAAATGEFIAFLDQDDLWHPDHIACCVEALQRHSDAPAVVARRQRFRQPRELRLSADGVATAQYDPWGTFPLQVIDTPSMVVARRSALDAIGGWPQTGGAAADCLAWWRLSSLDAFALTASRTVGVRESSGSMSVVDRRAPLDCLENMRRVALDAVGSRPVAERDHRATRASDLLDAMARIVAAIDDQQDVAPAALHLEAVLAPQSDSMVLLAIRFLGWLYGPRLQQAHASQRSSLLEVMLVQWPAQAVRTRREMRRLVATLAPTSDLLAFLASAPGCWSGWHGLVENLLAGLARGCGRVGDPLDLRVTGPGHSTAVDRGRQRSSGPHRRC